MPLAPTRWVRKRKKAARPQPSDAGISNGEISVPFTWRVGAKLFEWRTGVNPLNFLNGWKTFIGGIGMIATGVARLLEGDWEAGMALISAGIAAMGIGGKLEKAKAK